MKTQLGYFKKVKNQLTEKLGKKEAKKLISRSVYLISLGGNDYFAPYFRNTTNFQSYTLEEYAGMVVGNITYYIRVRTLFHKKNAVTFCNVHRNAFHMIIVFQNNRKFTCWEGENLVS